MDAKWAAEEGRGRSVVDDADDAAAADDADDTYDETEEAYPPPNLMGWSLSVACD